MVSMNEIWGLRKGREGGRRLESRLAARIGRSKRARMGVNR